MEEGYAGQHMNPAGAAVVVFAGTQAGCVCAEQKSPVTLGLVLSCHPKGPKGFQYLAR